MSFSWYNFFMKLLLTSAGLTNNTLVQALKDLVEKPFSDLNVTYIPTAANVEDVDKWWVVEDMQRVQQLGWKYFDIVDFSAVPKDIWLPRLERADVVVVGGGSSYHLMHAIESLDNKEDFINLLQRKVYVGISSGSMITAQIAQFGWDEEFYGIQTPVKIGNGLKFVDFYIMPHWGEEDFSKVTKENIAKIAKQIASPVYLIDNQTAIMIVDNKLTVVSEGTWQKIN